MMALSTGWKCLTKKLRGSTRRSEYQSPKIAKSSHDKLTVTGRLLTLGRGGGGGQDSSDGVHGDTQRGPGSDDVMIGGGSEKEDTNCF